MTPFLQEMLVFAAIGAAIGFFVVKALRRKKGGCGSGCGCGVKPKAPPRDLES